MTAKTHRINGRHFQNQKRETSADISWSSSSSDNEDNFVASQKQKRRKVFFKQPKTRWINTICPPSTISTTNRDDNSLSIPSTSTGYHSQEESPIIGSSNTKLSPTLGSKIDEVAGSLSPVIGKNQIINRIKRVCKSNIALQERNVSSEDSPEIVFSASSLDWNDDSQVSLSKLIEVSQISKTQCSQSEEIQIALTQDSSEVTACVTESVEQSGSFPLYCNLPRKRKRYKKNGVAFLLNKAVQRLKSSVGIWQHEYYLQSNRSDSIEEPCEKLLVTHKWKEYGCNMFECKPLLDVESKRNEVDGAIKIMLMNCSDDDMCNTNLEVGSIFKLYTPFNKKKVKHRSELVDCYFNVSKLILCSR